jgi:predicted N-acyltransferase
LVWQNKVKVFNRVDDVRESIDQISDDSFFTYEWFKTLESFGMLPKPFYMTITNEGEILGIAPCFIDEINDFFNWGPNILPFLHRTLNVSERLGLARRNLLLCYSPACCRSKILFASKYSHKEILSLFSKKIDEICEKQKILFSSFLFVSEFDELLMKNLESLNYTKFPNVVTFYLDVSWSNFEDYLKSLKHRMRLNIRREIKKLSDNGVTIEEEPLSENIAGKLSDLQANLSTKYDPARRNRLDPSFFMLLHKFAGAKLRLFVARKNEEIIGFSLSLQHKQVLDVYMCGFDYAAQTKTSFIYFNLCYYKPIQLAIDEKIKKIFFRYSTDKVKLNRGCRPEQTYSFIKCHNIFLGPLMNRLLKNRIYSGLRLRFLRDYFKNEL